MSENNNEPKNIILKDEENLVLDHNYDGIQELDHNLPKWWIWLFYITIVYSVGYCVYYFGPGPTLRQELDVAMAAIEAKKSPADQAKESDDMFVAWVKDQAHVQAGQAIYTSKCAACHGDKGQGLVGPNLTDDHWIHGEGRFVSLAKVIREGVLDKGMPPWQNLLSAEDVKNALAFIVSIHGSQPSGKAPQGEKYEWKVE